ncbi:hypothetical protein EVAR_13430_1 [Eumeta japonica]|uniref:Uncharacterized protein n=1 Tax=Eumeta variegata TaxID=151549 RepID=A0A4C1V660_EUMVA|nr:hypothetical protein EVAR_13430_1 [Eumeta japonica]
MDTKDEGVHYTSMLAQLRALVLRTRTNKKRAEQCLPGQWSPRSAGRALRRLQLLCGCVKVCYRPFTECGLKGTGEAK